MISPTASFTAGVRACDVDLLIGSGTSRVLRPFALVEDITEDVVEAGKRVAGETATGFDPPFILLTHNSMENKSVQPH